MDCSSTLEQRLAAEIALRGSEGRLPGREDTDEAVRCIPFARYMDMCLYDPAGGYYRSGGIRTGRAGDFYTSSAIGSVMGDKLAVYLAGIIGSLGREADAAEWGAGAGRLSQQVLDAWRREAHPWLAGMTYSVVDGHPAHLAEARQRLADRSAGLAGLRFLSTEQASEVDWSARPAVIFANELLDALPVHRVVRRNGRLWELGVALADERADGESSVFAPRFRYAVMPLSDPEIERSMLDDGVSLLENQEYEVNLAAERWVRSMCGRLGGGALILIDYGHDAAELAAPHRMKGTLLCYRNHMAHDDPFAAPGGQDMTAHVNFTAIRRAAAACGWETAYYGTQKRFLTDQGVLSDLTGHDGANPFGEAARRNRAIRQLLLSDGMSETFKVLALSRRGG